MKHAQLGRAALRQLTLAAAAALALGSMLATDRPAEASSLAALTPLAGVESTYDRQPVTASTNAPPLVMLVVSRDEQLFNKAYTDYTDLTGNGTINTTYTDSFDYLGYFDPHICYTYNGDYSGSNTNASGNYYSAVASATVGPTSSLPHQCGGTNWSGNFLNWISMSRLDLLRFTLYGGYRSTDATDNTIMERAYVPDDGHAWAKTYSGSDLSQYVPSSFVNTPSMSFCNATITSSNSISDGQPPLIRIASGNYTEWASTENLQCQWRSSYVGGTNGYAKPNVPNDTSVGQTGTKCPSGDTCTANTYTGPSCPSGANCTSSNLTAPTCPSGYSCSSSGLTAQPTCPTGYTCTTTTIGPVSSCPAGFSCSSNNYTGASCPSGYSCGSSTQIAPSCPSGYSCSSSTLTSQTSCPSGFTCTATNGSSGGSCPTGDTCTQSSGTPSGTCPSGYTCTSTNFTGQQTCPSGYTCTPSTLTAPSCPSGYSCSSGAQTGGSCPTGYTCSSTNYSGQSSCPSGYSCSSTTQYAASCPSGYSCGSSTQSSGSCPSGYSCTCTFWFIVCLQYSYTQYSYTQYAYTKYSYTQYSYTQYAYTQYTSTIYTVQLYSYTQYSYTQYAYTQYTYSQYAYTQYSYTQYSYTTYTYQGPDKLGEFTARVKVCDPTATVQESFCTTYTDASQKDHLKPTGLLQQYGQTGALKFGLITGSYTKPRSGGQLRRNIGLFSNNTPGTACASGDEVDLTTGNFCTSVTQGIVKTLNLLHQPGWNGSGYSVSYSGTGGNSNGDCATYGILNRDNISQSNGAIIDPGTAGSDYNCAGSGNPLAEMYAEAVRYIEGNGKSATSAYVGNDANYISGMPSSVTWTDPYSTSNWCAKCSIIVISDSSSSFDTDELPTDLNFANGKTATTATDYVGTSEGVNGTNQYIVGRNKALDSTTYADLCQAQTLGSLSQAIGICPAFPSVEGGYDIAGLAYEAWTNDLRPDLFASNSGNNNVGKPTGYVNTVKTYTVALSDPLPTYNIQLSGGTVNLSPLCEANNTAPGSTSGTAVTAPSSTPSGWRSCGFLSLTVGQRISSVSPNYVYGLPTSYSSSGAQTSGSFGVVYDDSSWGNDHDLDLNGMVSFCVGSTCSTSTNGANNGICWNAPAGNVCDGSGNIKSSVAVDGNTLLVRVEPLSIYAYNSMAFGFSIAGANTSSGSSLYGTTNGPYIPFVRPGCSGNNDLSLIADSATVPTTGNYSGVCSWGTVVTVMKFTGGGTAASNLQSPLYYAAKYGGFSGYSTSSCSNPLLPCQTGQWSTGVNPPLNGVTQPDNYFLVRNPSTLLTQLGTVFKNILNSAASGTAAAVVADSRGGQGATYQAYYVTTRSDSNGKSAAWLGNLQSMFIDSKGNLREAVVDSSGNATLTESDFTANPAVAFAIDTNNNLLVYRVTCDLSQPSTCPTPSPTTSNGNATQITIDQIKTIWKARDNLAGLTDAQVITDRSYTSPAQNGRYIFTFLDKNLNGVAESGEQVSLAASSFQSGSSNYYGVLNVGDATSASNLINYVRGQDSSTLRNRRLDYYGNGSTATYRLGDIVDSSPAVVGTPAEAYDLLYNDATYGAFRAAYQLRRQMIYVGANDGMLHAFNGGFYNANLTRFQTSSPDSTVSYPQHGLGQEMWAYVPFNLLPHLIWLSSPNYNHVFYFDGAPRIADVHIFSDHTSSTCTPSSDSTPQSCHPYGWGTIMIVGMRFGGGEISLPACAAASKAAFSAFSGLNSCSSSSTSITTHSAYAVLDITNPEEPPVVLAELSGTTPLSASTLGFTTSYPTIVPFSQINNSTGSPPSSDVWDLLFGSGPDSLPTASGYTNGTSTRDATLYLYRLAASGMSSGSPAASFDLNTNSQSSVGNSAANSIVGDPITVDWNLDFKADDIYVGLATGSSLSTPSGQLVKVATGNSLAASSSTYGSWTLSTLTNPGLPILDAPSAAFDPNGNHWVYAGTGRLFASGDKVNPGERQALLGVIDGTTTPTYSGLTDVTHGVVNVSTGAITNVTSATNESTLESTVLAAHGWKRSLDLPTDESPPSTTDSYERVLSATAVAGGILFADSYIPNGTLCSGAGASRLYGLNYLTGLPNPAIPAVGTYTVSTTVYANNWTSLGAGLAAGPSLHQDASGSQNGVVTVVNQTSLGSLNTINAPVSSGLTNAEVDWRATHPNTGP
ncbi:MAG: PilC/PilY family type IV pilus protein [Nevskia sp.]|nr:PilC/PilY family type IV pilus protein [Nevskia sp.]